LYHAVLNVVVQRKIIIGTWQLSFMQDFLKETYAKEYFMVTGMLFAFNRE